MKASRGKKKRRCIGKGPSFERSIAKQIVKAFSKFGIEQRECWRSVLSGGHWVSAGDLRMSDRLMKLFPFSSECKFYKEINWKNFWMDAAKDSREHKWIAQAWEGARKDPSLGLRPLLVMKENFGPIYAMPVDSSTRRIMKFSELLDNYVKKASKPKIIRYPRLKEE